LETLGTGMVVIAAAHAAALVALLLEHRRQKPFGVLGMLVVTGVGVDAGALIARDALGSTSAREWAVFTAAAMLLYCTWRRRSLLVSGAAMWSSLVLLTFVSGTWALGFLACLDVSTTTRLLLWAGVPIMLIGLPSLVVTQRESLEVLLRRRWRRQHRATVDRSRVEYPFVSIQVPCHAEPPDLVIETLNHLAALNYPAYEVMVIDNNTTDPELWQPVREHCQRLGPHFRFGHIEGITGAKAGALNHACPYIDPRASLVAVVDADYHVHPDWLRATVGFFDDRAVGFVQPPHAYRDWHHRRFGRWANWEYSVFFRTGMVALQEHDAGITVGTMSVIRLTALDAAGGWAEWCQTEDSELAIRIHDSGFRSIYLRQPLGWGLIPETFAAYRRQRYRWTFGPVQEFRRHWRRFLPNVLGGSRTLTPTQKLHHANHGYDVATIGLRLLLWPIALAAAASLLIHHETIPVPFELWLAATVLIVTSLAIRWLQYCHLTGAPLRHAVGAILAYQALTHTITVAALTALAGRNVPWQRTNKFTVTKNRRAAIADTRTETLIACTFLAAAAITINAQASGIATMLAIGFAFQAATYATAPLMALVADHDLDRELAQHERIAHERQTASRR
jgi:cellulose synthase/poly-beta-1,6-N-acetylglucosamine synthase-like glycosyltransferase